ncbi:MAG: tRNA (adenosine(37)-N6)-threonylcarbamoyltransferase complex dimerization subunit type 1 TsaB [Desulfofustis sp.]|jgi:tRNA threonylcarbamoyladenosine biosynthesis protein TsaB|nr:tRNA (adenosine(37)-N6)-threonylcarbamoyltransferase complex dimerization subunit type 1 TsaB [Desulfofustis sp.]
MKSQAPILAFDTATSSCSVAVTTGDGFAGRVSGSVSFDSGVTHSRRLLGAIDWLLRSLDLSVTDISAVAAGLGPGSFTGLRIGMATAKGLCHGASIPLIGISSLDAIAASIVSDKLICVVMDARKQEVYSCFYRMQADLTVRRCSEPTVMSPGKLARRIEGPVTMAGDGLDVYSDTFAAVLGDRMERRTQSRRPDAVQIGYLARTAFRDGRFLDIDRAKPEYIRSSDLQLSLVSPLDREQTC